MRRLNKHSSSLPNHRMIIAHRGLSGNEPENSLRAFIATFGRGVKAIEFDVRKTHDGVIVVCHDSDVMGLSIADSDYAELLTQVPDMCTLKQILVTIPSQCLLDVEIKVAGFEEQVLQELTQARNSNNYVITSFDDNIIARLKMIDQTVQTGLLLGKNKPLHPVRTRLSELFPENRLRSCHADFVVPHWSLLKLAFVQRMTQKGYPIYVWTVNTDEQIRSLIQREGIA